MIHYLVVTSACHIKALLEFIKYLFDRKRVVDLFLEQ